MAMEEEVSRIRSVYAARDNDPAVRAMWSPFSEAEVAHRNQQYVSLAASFRALGRENLSGLRILDVGCGQGRMVRACLDLGARPEDLVGVDVRASAIEEARRLSPHLAFRVGDGVSLDFPDHSFDLVMQFVVFSSIFLGELREHLAREMRRVLRPRGFIFWWDLKKTVHDPSPAELVPQRLFPGMPCSEVSYGLRPLPSTYLALPRGLKWVGRVLDRFSGPFSHTAALVGPRANLEHG
jgi:SAM-dependent methyltransferase